MAKSTKTGGSGNNSGGNKSRASLSGTDWVDDPRAIMQVAANARVTRGNPRPGDTYQSDSPAQQQRVDQHLAARRVAPTPAPASQRPVTGGSAADYVGMITDAAFGGPSITATPVGNRPAGSGKVAPVPRGRPANFNEEQQIMDAVNDGMSLQDIALGALGGGATALIAKRLLARGTQNPSTVKGPDAGTVTDLGPTDPKPNAPKSGDILTRNGLQSGVPTMNTDINRQFYELFGMPMPTNLSYGEFSEGNEPRLIPGPGDLSEPYEAYERPLTNKSNIPGPNQNVKQLGDMDSPTYRDNFGYSDIAMRAQDIVNKMEMYGDYNIGNYLDVSAEPAVARAVGAALRGMM